MAQHTEVVLVDDLDGGPADETVTFSLDGTAYEIDLGFKNAAKLRDLLGTYVGAARKAGRPASARGRRGRVARARTTTPTPAAETGYSSADIRSWAREQGLAVNARGRIPAEVVAAFEAAP
jgi:hypothetical protein